MLELNFQFFITFSKWTSEVQRVNFDFYFFIQLATLHFMSGNKLRALYEVNSGCCGWSGEGRGRCNVNSAIWTTFDRHVNSAVCVSELPIAIQMLFSVSYIVFFCPWKTVRELHLTCNVNFAGIWKWTSDRGVWTPTGWLRWVNPRGELRWVNSRGWLRWCSGARAVESDDPDGG